MVIHLSGNAGEVEGVGMMGDSAGPLFAKRVLTLFLVAIGSLIILWAVWVGAWFHLSRLIPHTRDTPIIMDAQDGQWLNGEKRYCVAEQDGILTLTCRAYSAKPNGEYQPFVPTTAHTMRVTFWGSPDQPKWPWSCRLEESDITCK